jgi:hypothetical protein
MCLWFLEGAMIPLLYVIITMALKWLFIKLMYYKCDKCKAIDKIVETYCGGHDLALVIKYVELNMIDHII